MTHEQTPPSAGPFAVRVGRANGLTPGVMRGPRFERPFHGMRVPARTPDTGTDMARRCAELAVVLPETAVFSHVTAARLWGMPLPRRVGGDLHVTVANAAPVRRPGVVGWTRGDPSGDIRRIGSLPVTSPADTWIALAALTDARGGRLTREELVAVGDHLLSGRRERWGRGDPLATRDELNAALVRHGSRRGAAALAWAFARLRQPVYSPQETLLRLGLVAARLPEPEVQPVIRTAAGDRHPDLAYVERGVLIEYLGDVHRTDRRTWRQDLIRVQLFEDAGYRVILAGADDVHPDGIGAFAARVRRALR